jgi:hypothetical protein
MHNRDTPAILGTQDTERKQKKNKQTKQQHKTTQHRKLKRYIYDHFWHCVQSFSSESSYYIKIAYIRDIIGCHIKC